MNLRAGGLERTTLARSFAVLELLAALTCARTMRGQTTTPPGPGERTTSKLPGEVRGNGEPSAANGVYGRFEGDLDLALELGTELDVAPFQPRAAVRASAHYFSMAGLYVGYRDALSEAARAKHRLLSTGVDLKPMFLPRWVKGYEMGPDFADLAIDSASLALGVYWAEPASARFGDERGFELSLGFGAPLFARQRGLWLEARGALRWPDVASAEASVFLLVSWHELFDSSVARAMAQKY